MNAFERMSKGQPLWRMPWKSWNRMAGILERLDGIGCHVERNGDSWLIVVDDGASGHHLGRSGGAASADEWQIEDDRPAIIELDGETRAKITVDSNGNVVGWRITRDGSEPDSPDDPPDDASGGGGGGGGAPPCGNPLNAPDPAGGPGGDLGAGETGRDKDDNPLDHEGDGGYTPLCG